MTTYAPPDSDTPLRAVVLNGSPSASSRTRVLLDALQARLAQALPLDTRFIDLPDLVPHIGTALSAQHLPAPAQDTLRQIGNADLLIVGSPVFKGSLPGLFKHLFDLIDQDALIGTPVLLAATGGSPRHSLFIDHQLRPLFSFFQALTLPIGVYGTPDEIIGGRIASPLLAERIELAASQALPVLKALQRAHQPQTSELLEA
ncbi:FMN reductase [Alcaligenaceae bacterium SJ-26]|nr:FMN reductase [Alcaligenaceae bacterium SJ-26]